MDPTDRLAAACERIATALETLTGLRAALAGTVECIRCAGRGHLGHPSNACHVCDGAGTVAA